LARRWPCREVAPHCQMMRGGEGEAGGLVFPPVASSGDPTPGKCQRRPSRQCVQKKPESVAPVSAFFDPEHFARWSPCLASGSGIAQRVPTHCIGRETGYSGHAGDVVADLAVPALSNTTVTPLWAENCNAWTAGVRRPRASGGGPHAGMVGSGRACNGFTLHFLYFLGGMERVARLLVAELQRRGLFGRNIPGRRYGIIFDQFGLRRPSPVPR
jgi:hypothetical protein